MGRWAPGRSLADEPPHDRVGQEPPAPGEDHPPAQGGSYRYPFSLRLIK